MSRRLALSLMNAPEGHPVSGDVFTKAQQGVTDLEMYVAIRAAPSRRAVLKMFQAEHKGLQRTNILEALARRLDDFDHPQQIPATIIA